MKEKLENYGFYAFLTLTAGVVLYLFFTIDLVQIGKINSLRTDLAGINERLNQLKLKNSVISNLNKNDLESKYRKVSFILPDLKDAPGILQTLDSAASSSGLTITALDFSPGKIASETSKNQGSSSNGILIKASGSGGIPEIAKFSEKILTSGRAIGLNNLDIKFNQEIKFSAKADFSLAAYYLAPVKKNLEVNQPLSELSPQDQEALARVIKTDFVPLEITVTTVTKPDLFK